MDKLPTAIMRLSVQPPPQFGAVKSSPVVRLQAFGMLQIPQPVLKGRAESFEKTRSIHYIVSWN